MFTDPVLFAAALVAAAQQASYTETFTTVPSTSSATFSGASGGPNPGVPFSFEAEVGSGTLSQLSGTPNRLTTTSPLTPLQLDFSSSPTGIQAVGGVFANTASGFLGALLASFTVTVTDVNNQASTETVSFLGTTPRFFGFISDGPRCATS